jgi:hypothetical protein
MSDWAKALEMIRVVAATTRPRQPSKGFVRISPSGLLLAVTVLLRITGARI